MNRSGDIGVLWTPAVLFGESVLRYANLKVKKTDWEIFRRLLQKLQLTILIHYLGLYPDAETACLYLLTTAERIEKTGHVYY